MNEGKTIFDLPEAANVPSGSRYAVEMGDGSGTKGVTHETMVRDVGKALPLGSTADLETTDKDTLVGAINEVKRKAEETTGGALIKVTTSDPGLFGRPVTVTDGTTTLTGTMSFTGECQIAGVTINGNLTVTASTEAGKTAEEFLTVTAYATYTVDLDSRVNYNRITVQTAEPGLYGKRVTATNGSNRVSGTIGPDGTASLPLAFSGQVTVTASDGTNTAMAQVNVAASGTASYDVTLCLYHLTVTTTDAKLAGKTVTLSGAAGSRTGIFAGGVAAITFDSSFLGECTVTATDGTKSRSTKFTATASTYSYSVAVKLFVVYTAVIDFSKSAGAAMITYKDDAAGKEKSWNGWKDMPIFKDLQNCVLKNGAVQYYLNRSDLTKKTDGGASNITTLGNDVMLEIPYRVGYSIQWDNGKLKVSVTDEPDNGSFKYDAFSLDSYNDCDKIYIGVFKGHASGNAVYSSSGKAVGVSQTIDTFRTWCRARGAGYQQRTNGSLKLMQCLYIISHGTLASQDAVGMGYVLSSHSAGVATGGTNAYGFDSEVIRASNPSYMTDQNHQVKCLGLEDFWGNYWEFIDGLASDANRNVLTCDIAKNFKTDGTGYKNNGNGGVTANIGGWMKLPQGGSDAGFVAKDVSGSDSTYFADSASLLASCLALFGGCWHYALHAGAFLLDVSNAFSLSYAKVGCRLMYMHKEVAA